jgi:hypothetical protein
MHAHSAKNVSSAGPLIQANAIDGVAIATDYNLEPGEVRVGTVRIANAGAEAGRFRLLELDASTDFDTGELTLEIDEFGDGRSESLFSGEIGAVPAEGIDLDRFEVGEERTYRFTVACSVDAAGSSLDRVAGAAYEWDAVSEEARVR